MYKEQWLISETKMKEVDLAGYLWAGVMNLFYGNWQLGFKLLFFTALTTLENLKELKEEITMSW